jgi:hypothetical protein
VLTAGVRYAITMEFFEAGGTGVARLKWKVPGTTSFVPVPKSSLYGN